MPAPWSALEQYARRSMHRTGTGLIHVCWNVPVVSRHTPGGRGAGGGGGGDSVGGELVGHPMVVGYRVQYAATVTPFWHAMHVAEKPMQQARGAGGGEAVGHPMAVGLAAQ